MTGDDIPPAFSDSNFFKQFADASQSEAAQIVMTNNDVTKNRLATVTYKANVSPTQTAGDYENTIFFVAAPTY
jgi:hypothetical protein